jgi:hypothetical protein
LAGPDVSKDAISLVFCIGLDGFFVQEPLSAFEHFDFEGVAQEIVVEDRDGVAGGQGLEEHVFIFAQN